MIERGYERDARIATWAQQDADSLIRVPREPVDSGPESAGQDAMTARQTDEPSTSEDAVAFLKQAREVIDEVEEWSGRGELLLDGKSGEWMGRIHEETEKWNAVISKVDQLEDARLLHDASVSFAKFTQVNPENPQALAKAAGAAYVDFGRLLEKSQIPIVSDMGQLLESARYLFEFGCEALDLA
jgi:hypothetical protein